jgi:hypothetical protein
MDPIDRSDHLTFATYIVAEPPAQALYFTTAQLSNDVISPSVKYLSDRNKLVR